MQLVPLQHVNGKLRQFLDGGAANFPQRRDHIQSTGYVGGTDPKAGGSMFAHSVPSTENVLCSLRLLL
jgi:hypothetical protein